MVRKCFFGNSTLVASKAFITSMTALSQAVLAATSEGAGQLLGKSGFALLRAAATASARLPHCCLSSRTDLLLGIDWLRYSQVVLVDPLKTLGYRRHDLTVNPLSFFGENKIGKRRGLLRLRLTSGFAMSFHTGWNDQNAMSGMHVVPLLCLIKNAGFSDVDTS